jgi:hypothetical protein
LYLTGMEHLRDPRLCWAREPHGGGSPNVGCGDDSRAGPERMLLEVLLGVPARYAVAHDGGSTVSESDRGPAEGSQSCLAEAGCRSALHGPILEHCFPEKAMTETATGDRGSELGYGRAQDNL